MNKLNEKIKKKNVEKNVILKWIYFQIKIKEKILRIPSYYKEIIEHKTEKNIKQEDKHNKIIRMSLKPSAKVVKKFNIDGFTNRKSFKIKRALNQTSSKDLNYLKSSKKDSSDNSYEAHKEKILESYGKEYLEKFVKNAENFIEFYTKGKQRKPRKEGQLKSIDIPIDETSETTSNKEIKNDGDENALFNKKMISSYAQTDICNVNSKLISFS